MPPAYKKKKISFGFIYLIKQIKKEVAGYGFFFTKQRINKGQQNFFSQSKRVVELWNNVPENVKTTNATLVQRKRERFPYPATTFSLIFYQEKQDYLI